MGKRQKKKSTQSIEFPPDDEVASVNSSNRMVYPIIIYPFSHPPDTRHLEVLYGDLIKKLAKDKHNFHRPVTVIEHHTIDKNRGNSEFHTLMEDFIEPYSEIIEDWSVETCQRWLTGFGYAYDQSLNQQRTGDVFWLIPGDFFYASDTGQGALAQMVKIPEKVRNRECEFCLGEITTPTNSSKQLIDTYGTYGLLYNWFSAEAQGIAKITSKPRTEFFAIGQNYLNFVLEHRWYPYEQTLAILLHGMKGRHLARKIHKVDLGAITDESASRDTLANAMSQVERIERMLKLFWREIHSEDPNWTDKFRILDRQSEQIRGAAFVIFEHVL